VIPRTLWFYYPHQREHFGGLDRGAWETVLKLMRSGTGDEGIRPGMVAVVQTAGDLANRHPHVHAIKFVTGHEVINVILRHHERNENERKRAPPN